MENKELLSEEKYQNTKGKISKVAFIIIGIGFLIGLSLIGTGITGKELERRLDEVHITLNKNAIPNDPESPFVTSGVRIGTPAVTARGFGKEEMLKIADFIYDVTFNFEESKERVTKEVIALCEKFPIYQD